MRVDRPMCEAMSAASLLPGRNPRNCAAHACKVVGHGMPHHVCEIHFNMWERACIVGPLDEWVARTAALAARWGWPDRETAAEMMEERKRDIWVDPAAARERLRAVQ